MSKQPEILSCVQNGTPDEIMLIVNRVKELPEFGLLDRVYRIAILRDKVRSFELHLSSAKEDLIASAESLIQRVLSNWTSEEIEKATGYKNET